MERAAVFNIQKFSLDDGPGIRTTVFLKGCPLRCAWCANPESQLRTSQLEWDGEKCARCGACARACADGSVTFDGHAVQLDPARAGFRESARAHEACPTGALSLVGRERSVDDVLAACLQDEPFYEQSGGGVTLSGGEPLTWPDFCCELLGRLREHGIHTALETTGYADSRTFERVAPYANLLLFDVKHWDDAHHRAGTGVSREPICANLSWAVAHGLEVLPRIPVIPGFNFDAAHPEVAAEGFTGALQDVGASRCQLLPFHQLGENKYALLQRDYALAGAHGLREEDLAGLVAGLRRRGVDAFV